MRKIKCVLYAICAALFMISVWNLWEIYRSKVQTISLYEMLAEKAHQAKGEIEGQDEKKPDELSEKVKAETEAEGQAKTEDTERKAEEGSKEISAEREVVQEESNETTDESNTENEWLYVFKEQNEEIIGQTENCIIYGHHMKDGTMFADLMKYKKKDFCETNGSIQIDTEKETAYYKVIAVMVLSEQDTKEFPFYQYIYLK